MILSRAYGFIFSRVLVFFSLFMDSKNSLLGAKKPACIGHGGLGGRFKLTPCKRSVVQFHIGGQHIKPAATFALVLVAFVFVVVFQQSPI